MADQRHAEVIEKDRARQGVTGHNVRYVLFGSLALVVIAFIAVAIFMRP
jgi:hypothetical protein